MSGGEGGQRGRAAAEGGRGATGAPWAIAGCGLSGPCGGSADKPVGRDHSAVAGPDGSSREGVRFGASRGRGWIQALTAGEALNRLRLRLELPGDRASASAGA